MHEIAAVCIVWRQLKAFPEHAVDAAMVDLVEELSPKELKIVQNILASFHSSRSKWSAGGLTA